MFFGKSQGIRIHDVNITKRNITLPDILDEIWFGSNLNWLITFLDGAPNGEQAKFLKKYQAQINNSEKGIRIEWNELLALSSQYHQLYEIEVLGSINPQFLTRYEDEEEAFEKCDIVIMLIDCTFFEVYAKDKNLIEKLKLRFDKTEIIYSEN